MSKMTEARMPSLADKIELKAEEVEKAVEKDSKKKRGSGRASTKKLKGKKYGKVKK